MMAEGKYIYRYGASFYPCNSLQAGSKPGGRIYGLLGEYKEVTETKAREFRVGDVVKNSYGTEHRVIDVSRVDALGHCIVTLYKGCNGNEYLRCFRKDGSSLGGDSAISPPTVTITKTVFVPVEDRSHLEVEQGKNES
jgi:hypothetical protein